MGDFTVDTNMHCFLCSDRINHQHQPMKPQYGSSKSIKVESSLHSLQSLSHYLKIDTRKVFIEEETVPHQLLAKVKNAKLKVELCAECTTLNEIVSKLIQKLNKIEMEVSSYIHRIHRKLMWAESEDNNNKNFLNLGDLHDNKFQLLEGKRQIANLLRSEMMQKCSPIITNARPRIKLQRLTGKQVNRRSGRIRPIIEMKYEMRRKQSKYSSDRTSSIPKVESLLFKVEEPDQDPLLEEDDEDMGLGNTYPEYNHDLRSEDEESNTPPSPAAPPKVSVSKRLSRAPKKYFIQNGIYKCQSCMKEYSSNAGLRFHYKSAHAKIRYECKLCPNLRFNHPPSLNRHNRTVHRGIRFKCNRDNCDKSFTGMQRLRAHIQSVHNNQRHSCRFCSKSYSREDVLRGHLKLNRCKVK